MQERVGQLLRGVVYDTGTFNGSLGEWFLPLPLVIEAAFVQYTLVQLSAVFIQFGAIKYSRLSPT